MCCIVLSGNTCVITYSGWSHFSVSFIQATWQSWNQNIQQVLAAVQAEFTRDKKTTKITKKTQLQALQIELEKDKNQNYRLPLESFSPQYFKQITLSVLEQKMWFVLRMALQGQTVAANVSEGITALRSLTAQKRALLIDVHYNASTFMHFTFIHFKKWCAISPCSMFIRKPFR